ncbi:hydrogenase nickel incorporation protein HypB [Streptomyces clavuligerus]|uniref:Hydrogenase accessory protein n=1 Tax=Streptomyces clavuligerus TaxID=1901 RepID=B5H083_STRCL|nr:hydrogenase nickel incorporation protein HypB [Streptomyces clavuligerus]ANW21433.1 hydrogenase accessory protein HypB [Streptomyces clavuligerus]AXU16065.1 hydrogenase accessory protein HypB [Streptomyces clavuligerus]EDY51979.1 hydrogenase expression/formation protein [Streptomyces clavuligerus]EFG05418.1 Hydrogenase accessory protein [Streptomyces clavuligerus]MBY6306200.1 hydrogenase nickel incorporation protein HypB [Streptomyces clavuligerus]
MCRSSDLRQAVLARNDDSAALLRSELAARGTVAVNLLSSPGSGKTALLEGELAAARERGVPVAALTADLATENDARRLARTGVPVQQILTGGLCHLEAVMLRGYLAGWLPPGTRVLFLENVGNLVCPAVYDLGESLRVTLASVTEGEDKPLKYPTAFGLAQVVLVTKTDLAAAVGFDEEAFLENVARVNPGVEVVFTSARDGRGTGALLERALAVQEGAVPHRPVLARTPEPAPAPVPVSAVGRVPTVHEHAHAHTHDHPAHGHDHAHTHDHTPHDHDHRHDHGSAAGAPHPHGAPVVDPL